MYYPDLGTECQVDQGPHVRAVGWLSEDHPFPTGPPDSVFVEALREQVAQAWQPVAAGGSHVCEYCEHVWGSDNVWIPGGDVVFVAPALITHYVEAHSYAPPDAFVRAVQACPPQGSREYFALMRRFPGWWAHTLPA
ncbi:MAG TPA: hypothetical protein VGC13_13960 [Longimicrobium sp.]|jgi:hypothetical protein|uniref:DUF7919 family protein n=1 Tax=Longimicrobium sp. TaxID=2029185 RepID=UPI002EDB2AEB